MSKISIVTLHRVTGQETLKVLLPSLRPVNFGGRAEREQAFFDILPVRRMVLTSQMYSLKMVAGRMATIGFYGTK